MAVLTGDTAVASDGLRLRITSWSALAHGRHSFGAVISIRNCLCALSCSLSQSVSLSSGKTEQPCVELFAK